MDQNGMLRVTSVLSHAYGTNDYLMRAVQDALATEMSDEDIEANAPEFTNMIDSMINVTYMFTERGRETKSFYYPVFGELKQAKINLETFLREAFIFKTGYRGDALDESTFSSHLEEAIDAVRKAATYGDAIEKDLLGRALVDFFVAFINEFNYKREYCILVYDLAVAIAKSSIFHVYFDKRCVPSYKLSDA
ncbi:MAG: hypothetical protein K6F57_00970 [Candidatus Saccharibacteria bacterium]|nr:hypothetical protein [Candidatus Saccharibacteria bacterium]